VRAMSSEEGAASVAAAAVAGLLVAVLLLVGAGGRAVAIGQRTAAAADLAALAAASAVARLVVEPCSWASRSAAVNGARLVRCSVEHPVDGPTVEVVVRSGPRAGPWGHLQRSARAGLRPVSADPAATGLAPRR